jgi:hypothetical protein
MFTNEKVPLNALTTKNTTKSEWSPDQWNDDMDRLSPRARAVQRSRLETLCGYSLWRDKEHHIIPHGHPDPGDAQCAITVFNIPQPSACQKAQAKGLQ